MTLVQELRRIALYELLSLPDEPCLLDVHGRPRGYRRTVPRDPLRSPDIIKRDLGTAYVAHRRHDYGQDISCIVSINAQPKLRLVR